MTKSSRIISRLFYRYLPVYWSISIDCHRQIHNGEFRRVLHDVHNNVNDKVGYIWGAVATVNNKVGSCRVTGCIRCQVEICTFQLLGTAFATPGDLVAPDILGLLRNKVGYFSCDIPRRGGVGAAKIEPFDCE